MFSDNNVLFIAPNLFSLFKNVFVFFVFFSLLFLTPLKKKRHILIYVSVCVNVCCMCVGASGGQRRAGAIDSGKLPAMGARSEPWSAIAPAPVANSLHLQR